MCREGAVTMVKFPSVGVPRGFEGRVYDVIEEKGGCPWLDTGFRLRGVALDNTKEDQIALSMPGKVPVEAPNKYEGVAVSGMINQYLPTNQAWKLSSICNPDGKGDACVLQGPYGQCGTMYNPGGCSYFAFLENPVERMVGLYNVYCKGVETDGVTEELMQFRSGRSPGSTGAQCPDLSIVEFATQFGNVYTKAFSGKYKAFAAKTSCLVNGGRTVEEECGFVAKTTDVEYHKAVKVVSNEVATFIMDEEYADGLRSWARLFGGEEVSSQEGSQDSYKPYVPKYKLKMWEYLPTGQEKLKLRDLLQHDIKLYARSKEVFRSELKDWTSN